MDKKGFIGLSIWVVISIVFFFGSVGNIDKDGSVYGWFISIKPGWLPVFLFFYIAVMILGLIAAVRLSGIKKKKKTVLLTLSFILAIFVAQQIFAYITTSRSCIFTYRGSVTPKDYNLIYNKLFHQIKMPVDNNKFPSVKSLCNANDKIELAENQPLKDCGIELIHNKETDTIYLYGSGLETILLKEYPQDDKWCVVLFVNYYLDEKPKGTYHSFKLSRKGNDWLAITTGRAAKIDSWIPPIPGCLYNIEEKKIYVPPELLLVYKVIYPNIEIPVTSFRRN